MTMRLGILGGTFDPLHHGHVAAADAARRRLGLDRVIVVPALDPPHRPSDPHASSYHRFAMAALAVAGLEGFEMSDLEMLRPPPSYTAHTLAHLADEGYHPSQLFFITGTDAFAEVATWHEYPRVLDLTHFVVVARPGHGMSAVRDRLEALTPRMLDATTLDPSDLARIDAPGAPTRVLFLETPTPDISATDIRHRIASGRSIAGLVAPSVAAYIDRHHLYRVSASRQTACMSKTESPRTRKTKSAVPASPVASFPDDVRLALKAALDRKATNVVVLDLRGAQAFTDFFVVCTGQTARQVNAIADAIEAALKRAGVRPEHIEGTAKADWVLMDYFDFIVHVFTPDCREFYALERLWGSAMRVDVSDADVA